MECPSCHTDNPEDSRFCAKCGTKLQEPGPMPFSKTITIGPAFKVLKEGTIFANKYRIISEIGKGGMGIVLKAEDTKLKRVVALKLLPADLSRSLEARERFVREAQSAAALDHPNICTVYEVEEYSVKNLSSVCIARLTL
jgi:serine/threonine protein kinase